MKVFDERAMISVPPCGEKNARVPASANVRVRIAEDVNRLLNWESDANQGEFGPDRCRAEDRLIYQSRYGQDDLPRIDRL